MKSLLTCKVLVTACFVCGLPITWAQSGSALTQFPAPIELQKPGRPLVDALDNLQNQYSSPITFEEAPYESDQDLPVHVVVGEGFQKRVEKLPLTVDKFAVHFDLPVNTPAEAALQVLSVYEGLSLPGRYAVMQMTQNRVDVTPARLMGVDGKWRDVVPVMHQPVTIAWGKHTVEETLQELVAQVSKSSGYKVELLDRGFSETDSIEIGTSSEPAGDVIFQIGEKLGVQVSFRCLYDVTTRTYYLRVQQLAPPAQRAVAAPTAAGPSPSRSEPATNAYFDKK